jgi:hypothetical protein
LPSHTTTERSERKTHTHTHTLPQRQHHKYWTQAKLYNLLLSFALTGELEIGNNKKKKGGGGNKITAIKARELELLKRRDARERYKRAKKTTPNQQKDPRQQATSHCWPYDSEIGDTRTVDIKHLPARALSPSLYNRSDGEYTWIQWRGPMAGDGAYPRTVRWTVVRKGRGGTTGYQFEQVAGP